MGKRILVYDSYSNTDFPTGGSNRSLLLFLEHRNQRSDIEYFFLTNQISRKYYESYVKKLGVNELHICFPSKLMIYNKRYQKGFFTQLFLFVSNIVPFNFRLAKKLKEVGIDLVVCNEGRAALTIAFAAKLARTKCITFIRLDGSLDTMLSRVIYSLSNKLICISQGMYDLLPSKGKKKAVIAQHGIPLSNPMKKEHKGIILTNIANITPRKNQLVLLKAVKLLVAKHEDLTLRLIGGIADENYYKSLESFVKFNHLERSVEFLGFVKDVDNHLSVTDIYVQPSDYEGLGRSILEAYLHEVPVVGTNIPGIMSIVRDGVNGFLFEKGNEHSLAEKLDYLISNSQERINMGRFGRKILETEFSIDRNVREIEEALELDS